MYGTRYWTRTSIKQFVGLLAHLSHQPGISFCLHSPHVLLLLGVLSVIVEGRSTIRQLTSHPAKEQANLVPYLRFELRHKRILSPPPLPIGIVGHNYDAVLLTFLLELFLISRISYTHCKFQKQLRQLLF